MCRALARAMKHSARSRLVVLSSVVLCLAVGCGPRDPDADVAAFAGSDAVDCGRIPAGLDGSEQELCVARAFQQGQPFHVGFDQHGIDSTVIEYFVGDRQGHVHRLVFDSISGGRFTCSECDSPRVDAVSGFVECDAYGPETQRCP